MMKYLLKKNAIRIRTATHADIHAMVELLKTLFSIEADFKFDEVLQRKGLSMMLQVSNERRCLLVAEDEFEVIGMCSARFVREILENRLDKSFQSGYCLPTENKRLTLEN